MNQNRPIARLCERFPLELKVRKMMNNAPLELRFSKQRLVLSNLDDGTLLCEIEQPTDLKSGHGWGLITQLRFEPQHVAVLHSYLTERLSEKV
jgi:hypothetical protein